MVNKHAFMKTLEILLVVVLTTLFMLVIIPNKTEFDDFQRPSYLLNLEENEEFRSYIAFSNNVCYNSSSDNSATELVERYLPNNYDYWLCVEIIPGYLPPIDVTIDSLVIVGNYSKPKFKIVRLFYWSENN